MTEIAKALYAFYSGFGLPAYTEEGIPAEAQLPYISYTLARSALFDAATHQVRIWYRGESNAPVNAKADEILAAIGQGVKLPVSGGYVCIYPGSGALAQMQPSDEDLRIVYLNLYIRSYVG